MKTDKAPLPPLQPAPDAFQAFFSTLDAPAALCDADLRLLASNPAFDLLCGGQPATGRNLAELLHGVDNAVPANGSTGDVDVVCQSGQTVTLTLSRRGDTVAVVSRQLSHTGNVLADAGRVLMEHARVEQTLLELGRSVAGATSEEELVAVVARGVKGLYPGRAFCVRIVDPKSCGLTSLYAEGRMRDEMREKLVFRRTAVQKTHLATVDLPKDRVVITDGEVPRMFQGTSRSISAPLVASGQLFGVINVEYPEGMTADLAADDRVLIQLANQVAVGVRNAKLIDELTFVRKYLEELLENANALIFVVNRDRKVVVFNKQLATLTGFPREKVLGQDLLAFIPEAEKMRVLREVGASLRGQKSSTFETRVARHSGPDVRVSFATSTVHTPQGEVEGVIAIGQDLTQVRELERRMIHAEKLSTLGQLAASVVHEINNPMTAVVTYVDSLLSRSTDANDRLKLSKVQENCARILRFTTDLTSYARPAQEKTGPVDLREPVELAVTFCEHVLAKHQVRVEKKFEEVPLVRGVKANLVQVFINLITNACHAMKASGTLELGLYLDGPQVVAKVSDCGAGIRPEDLARIFEPFFTTKAEGRGTGLGLSIVQKIVDGHGGDVEVTSQPGRGTTFLVRLPVASQLPTPPTAKPGGRSRQVKTRKPRPGR